MRGARNQKVPPSPVGEMSSEQFQNSFFEESNDDCNNSHVDKTVKIDAE